MKMGLLSFLINTHGPTRKSEPMLLAVEKFLLRYVSTFKLVFGAVGRAVDKGGEDG